MVRLADLTTRSAQSNGRNSEKSVHEGREYVAVPPVEEQYAPEPRMIDPGGTHSIASQGHDGACPSILGAMVTTYSVRSKVSGAVMQFNVRGAIAPAAFVQAVKDLDPGAEFETELRREFGQKGELKRGVLQMVTIESRGDKVTVVAIGPNPEGHQVRADAWLDGPKATELLAMLQLDDTETAVAQRALDGKEPGVLTMANRGAEFSWKEFEKDGKVNRRLAEFHYGGASR